MNAVETSAKTVDEAISEALNRLQTTRDEVEVEVLEEGTKGFLGIIGSKQAKVRVTRKPKVRLKQDVAKEFTEELLRRMQVDTEVSTSTEEEVVRVDVRGENLGLLIGRKGQTLNSLQYLIGLVVNREGGEWSRIVVDVEGYRDRREDILKAQAVRLAQKAKATSRRQAMEPMNAQERRIVHNSLQEIEGVETHSEGRDPFRRVIIVPKRS